MNLEKTLPTIQETAPKKLNREIIVLIGPNGCGKTSFAINYISKNPNWVRVSRDDQRRQIIGYFEASSYFSSPNSEIEKHVTNLQMDQIRYWLQQGKNVIVDNTHLKLSYIKAYQDLFGHMAEIIFIPITKTTIEECKERLQRREGESFNTDYLDKQFNHFNNLLKSAPDGLLDVYQSKRNPLYAEFRSHQEPYFPECVLIDIDGTVADCRGIRSPSNGEKLHYDRVIEPVRLVLNKLVLNEPGGISLFGRNKKQASKIKIIYVSGRDDKWKDATIQWIKDNDLPFHNEIYMRKPGDQRSDYIVKSEILLTEIAPYYKPLFAIDDRLSVCHQVWYKAGIFCFNVNQGLKNF